MAGTKIPPPVLIDLDFAVGKITFTLDYSTPIGKTPEGTKEFGVGPSSLLIIAPGDDEQKGATIYLSRRGMRNLKAALSVIDIPESDI